MICRQFGGDILVHSELGKGANFTFLFALDELKNNSDQALSRRRNPNKKFYAKIKLPVCKVD